MNRRAVIYPVVILVLLAAGVFVFRSGRTVADEQLRLERILSILELDPELLWRQRPNLATRFEGSAVTTDRDGFRISRTRERVIPRENAAAKTREAADPGPPGDSGCGDHMAGSADGDPLRIVTFGASPTFGYGAEEAETYPRVAESLLRDRGFDAVVINAGQIGYSSHQGRGLIRKYVDALQPDIATVSYMVNDIDRLRFFFSNGLSDSEVSPPSRFRSTLFNLFDRTPGLTTLRRLRNRVIMSLAGERPCRAIYEVSRIRVLPGEYEENLLGIRNTLAEHGVSPLFIAVPFRLPEPIPPAPPRVEDALDGIDSLVDAGASDAVWSEVMRIRELDPFSSRSSYLEGRVLELRGEAGAAKEVYCRAVKEIIYDCARDASRYNGIMRSVARKTGTPLLDVTAALGGAHAEMSLFLEGDYIHPNARGHAIIGRCLAEQLVRMISGEAGLAVAPCN